MLDACEKYRLIKYVFCNIGTADLNLEELAYVNKEKALLILKTKKLKGEMI
jgi:hypothetical protein